MPRPHRGDLLGNAIGEDAVVVAEGMNSGSPLLRVAISKQKLRVIAAHHGLADGKVELLEG